MNALAKLNGVIPPPLTPPHKGEGNGFVAIRNIEDWYGAAMRQGSPPPCGEGLGVGVFQMQLPHQNGRRKQFERTTP